MLRAIQDLPGLLPFALGVHYSLLPKVITPLLALIVWLWSLPAGASLITFVCANDLVNTCIKWAVQRPRPRWYSPDAGLVTRCGAWEVDLSFPSAHTQFFGGLGFCACALYGWPLAYACAFGFGVGFMRNYLSVHWPSDTLVGLLIGGGLGVVWGVYDPYGALMRAASPSLSVRVATGFVGGLVGLLCLIRRLVPSITDETRSRWYANAVAALPPEDREETLSNPSRLLQPRTLYSKLPMIVTVWCALAMTALYPSMLPTAAAEPGASLAARLVQAAVGIGGLAAVSALKKSVGEVRFVRLRPEQYKPALKALTYMALCAWSFLLSQLAARRVLALLAL